jgi:hypothetical protein
MANRSSVVAGMSETMWRRGRGDRDGVAGVVHDPRARAARGVERQA